MLRPLSIGLLASAVAIAPLPTKAQDGSAEDLGDVNPIDSGDGEEVQERGPPLPQSIK